MKKTDLLGFVTALVFITSQVAANSNRIVSETLKTKNIFQDNANMWGTEEMCPENHFVSGLRLHFQPYQGKVNAFWNFWLGLTTYGMHSSYNSLAHKNDDQGLLGIELYCLPFHANPNFLSGHGTSITSKVGSAHQSVWSERLYCDTGDFAVGFQLRVQQRQQSGDNHAATNFKVICSSKKKLTTKLSHEVGDWPKSGYKMCKNNSAICGLKTKVEDADASDRHGLEAAEIYCCQLPAKTEIQLAQGCTPRVERQLIACQDNTDGLVELQQTYTKKTGISELTSSGTLHRESNNEANSQTWGINSGASVNIKLLARAALKQNFQTTFNNSKSRNYEVANLVTNSMNTEAEHKVSYVVPPGHISKIYQYVGYCGPYTIHSEAIKKIDETPREITNSSFAEENSNRCY